MAGTCIRPPFINFDIKKYDSWDTKPHCIFEVGDVRKLPYPDNYFWVIFNSELMEHLTYSDGVEVLKEFYRTLKPGGVAKICCPDFEFVVKLYTGQLKYKDYDQRKGLLAVKNGNIEGVMGPIWSVLYGANTPLGDGRWYTEHKTVWDNESLTYYLGYVGFKEIERVNDKLPWSYPVCNERDLCVEAWKP